MAYRLQPIEKRVIIVVTLILTLRGCVWAPPISEEIQGSGSPIIFRDKVIPSPDNTVVFTTKGTRTFDVRGAIWDPDDNIETLMYYWFMDYPDYHEPPFLQGMGSKASFQLDPCSVYIFKQIGGIHYLELIVTDGTVEYDVTAQERVINGGYAYISWFLDVRDICSK